MMTIQKLKPEINELFGAECLIYSSQALLDTVNQLVDAVNEIMTWRFETDDETPAENVQDHKIRSTNERLRKALGIAQNALIKLANDAYDMDEHIYIDNILNQIERITKGGKDE